MLLKNLINTYIKNSKQIKVLDLSLDSRKVKKGDLFFALQRSKKDGSNYINEAILKGASAIICSKYNKYHKSNIPIIKVKNVQKTLKNICIDFYKKKPKNIIAVTGTNGKSSVAEYFHQILSNNKIPVATIGTLGIKTNNKIKKINLTSPDIISLHKELENIKKKNINNVIIEASSHGLEQGRLDGINFKAGIFTNFSQDHLDYHKTMKSYLNSKLILFSKLLNKKKYIITDNKLKEFAKIKKIASQRKIKILTINNNYKYSKDLKNSLIGEFQYKNLLMSILASKLCGLNEKQIRQGTKKIKNINGRLELIRTLSNQAKVFVDYAHTPDALMNVLQSLKNYYKEKITLVFGCGGERDFKKRKIMARISQKYCEKILVTDDNPRNENPKKIRNHIIKHLKKGTYKEIADRTKAIKSAISDSAPSEIILIAGKGHETYQDYGKKIFNFSDKLIIKQTKNNKKKKINKKEVNINWNSKIMQSIINKKNNYKFFGISINSKTTKKNNLFIPLKGANNDGHTYIKEALKKGASYSLSSSSRKITLADHKKIIKCDNTLNFLNKLAQKKRNLTSAQVIAITGSSGKTTLKAIIGNLLNNFSDTYFSPKSYNNHYGVPFSLSNLEKNHKYGVFEIGMSKKGEINKLSKMVNPDIAVITNVAEAHMKNFEDIKKIAKAKSEIINNVKKDGILIINRDDKFYSFFKKIGMKKKLKIISFGNSSQSDVHLIKSRILKNEELFKIRVIDEIVDVKAKSINSYNILSSLAVVKILNLDIKKTLNFYKSNKLLEGRGKIYNVKRFKINFNLIDESYNANPLSVKNAIKNLTKLKTKNSKKYLLLGDMLELGSKSNLFHKNLSKFINKSDIDKVFIYGNKIFNAYKYTEKIKRGNILQYIYDFDEVFSSVLSKGDFLMIKGSNATGLNKLSKNIVKGFSHVI